MLQRSPSAPAAEGAKGNHTGTSAQTCSPSIVAPPCPPQWPPHMLPRPPAAALAWPPKAGVSRPGVVAPEKASTVAAPLKNLDGVAAPLPEQDHADAPQEPLIGLTGKERLSKSSVPSVANDCVCETCVLAKLGGPVDEPQGEATWGQWANFWG